MEEENVKKTGKIMIFSIVLLGCMLGFLSRSSAEEVYQYETNADGTLTITGMNTKEENVVIPETIGDKTVTAIAAKAFYGADMVTVSIPASVKTIGAQAFQYCTKLTTVTFAETGLTGIGKEAFSNCKAVKELTLPVSVETVAEGAFANMGKLTLTSSALTTTYGKNVFQKTTLSEVTLMQSATLYDYVKNSAKKIHYIGAYFDSLSQEVLVGGQQDLKLKQAEDETVVWTSSNDAVASVENGIVTAKKAGTVKIKAQMETQTLTVTVTVKNLSISEKSITLTKGFSKTLSVKHARQIKWSSSNKKVASVSSKGKVTGKKEGSATVTAKVGAASYKCKVKVVKNMQKFSAYSKNGYSYNSGVIGFSSIEKTKNGYRLKGHFINGTKHKIQYIKGITVVVKDGNKVVAKRYYSKLNLNTPQRASKALTFTFTGSNVKRKNVDLRNCVILPMTQGGKYFYETTKTVEVEVPAGQ